MVPVTGEEAVDVAPRLFRCATVFWTARPSGLPWIRASFWTEHVHRCRSFPAQISEGLQPGGTAAGLEAYGRVLCGLLPEEACWIGFRGNQRATVTEELIEDIRCLPG